MDSAKPIYIYPAFAFVGYPNRDSSPYTTRYNIPECRDLIRGTLRYQGFPSFVKALVAIGFLDETPIEYLSHSSSPIKWKSVLQKILGSIQDDESSLISAVIEKTNLTGSPEEAHRIIQGLRWLGLFSDEYVEKRGNFLDTLCATLEKKMMYEEGERDMVMLQHKFGIEYADGSKVIVIFYYRKQEQAPDFGLEFLEEIVRWQQLLGFHVLLRYSSFLMVLLLNVGCLRP